MILFYRQEFCNSLDSSPPTSPPVEKPEAKQEGKPEEVKKDKSVSNSVPADATDISAIEDILQLLKVLYSISTTSAFHFGEGGKI